MLRFFLFLGYVLVVIFLVFIVIILIGFLVIYYCLNKEMCFCFKMEFFQKIKGVGYEELGEELVDIFEEEEGYEEEKDGVFFGEDFLEKLLIFEMNVGGDDV